MFKLFVDGLIVLGGHQWEDGKSKCLRSGLWNLGLAEPCPYPACHQEAARAVRAAEISYLATNSVVPHLGRRAVCQSHSCS